MSIFRDFGSSARSHRAPGTVGLVIAMIAGFLALWMKVAPDVMAELGFMTLDAWAKPWTFFTYPFLSDPTSFIGLIFLCMWVWGIGGSVERELDTTKYLVVWVVFSVLCALAVWIGSALTGQNASMWGGWTPVAAITVIWGTRNADAQILLMFVLPITGRWMAWLAAGLVFFGTNPTQLAPFAAAPLILAYLFAANKLAFAPYSGSRRLRTRGENAAGTRKVYKQEYYDDVKRREQQRAEKEKLKKLFEQSMIDDPDADKDK